MRTPYLWLVALVARAVGGEYPKHYDSTLRRHIRIVLGVSTGIFAVVVLATDQSTSESFHTISGMVSSFTNQPVYLGIAMLIVVVVLVLSRIASLRRRSIEEHVLQTNLEEVTVEDSLETSEDAITLYDFLKVYAAMFLITFIPKILVLAGFPSEPFSELEIVLGPINSYNLFLVLDFGGVLFGRWGRQFINNDRSEAGSGSVETN